MDRSKKHSGPRRFFSGLTALILGFVLFAVIYAAAALLHSPELQSPDAAPQETPAPVSPLQPGVTGDMRELQALFGAPLPVLSDHPATGSTENAVYDGQTVRKATLQYEGFTVTAVQPASAAALLLRPELSVVLRSDLILFNCPAVLAGKGSEWCVYFSTPRAAYAVYAPQADEESFLALLEHLVWQAES